MLSKCLPLVLVVVFISLIHEKVCHSSWPLDCQRIKSNMENSVTPQASGGALPFILKGRYLDGLRRQFPLENNFVIISKENRKSKIPSRPAPEFVIILLHSGAHMHVYDWENLWAQRDQTLHLWICGDRDLKWDFSIREFTADKHWNNIQSIRLNLSKSAYFLWILPLSTAGNRSSL